MTARKRKADMTTATSRTPPWLVSGWGCSGQRFRIGRQTLVRVVLKRLSGPSRRDICVAQENNVRFDAAAEHTNILGAGWPLHLRDQVGLEGRMSVRRHKRLPLNQKAENVECRRETGGVGSAVGIGS